MSIELRAKQYGTIFGNWNFDKLIGTGSGGKTVVYQLKRSNLSWEETSVLKVVSIIEENGKLEQFSDSFKKDYEKRKKELCQKATEEVYLMYKVRENTHIVSYFDHRFNDWQEENRFGCDLLIRMELLDNLREQMKRGMVFTEAKVIQIGKDICKALIGCHKENIIHRDIKPENIFVNSKGTYKLGDFGISRMLENSQSASTNGGTPPYAAPEQFKENNKKYDYRVDIYSLGLVLYELSNENRLPFATSTYIRESEIKLRVIGKTIEKPCNASPMFAEVILKACAYEPEQRYQSAEEFLEALNMVQNAQLGNNSIKHGQEFRKNQNTSNNLYETMLASVNKNGNVYTENGQNQQYETMPATVGKEVQKQGYETTPAKAEKKEEKVESNVVKTILKKAEQGDAEAQDILANHYYYGDECEKDYKEAVKWYRKSAEQGNAYAQYNLGICYYNGNGVEKDYKEAVKWYRKSAEQGNAYAQYSLGDCYYYGDGVEKDYKEAVKWYRESAEQGDAYAQSHLGDCYCCGEGVEKDYQEAVKWYRKSAEQRNTYAQNNLGNCYYYRRGVEKDYQEAVKWYRKSAEQGNAYAQNNLGNCYYYGDGVEKDYKEAVKWYRESAEQGNKHAQNSLGNCYYYGNGVEKDYKEAVKWYQKAAEQGHIEALEKLGDCYYNGFGVEKDIIKGISLRLSAKHKKN